MSLTNDIRKLIDIQDSHITFEENFFEMGILKGQKCKFIKGKLSYTPTECAACGIENQNYNLYKNGTQTSRLTLPFIGMYPAYLLLKKQRFMCKACECSFTAKTSVVKKNCFISQNVKSLIIIKASEARSIKSIAKDCSVSSPTVQRQINEAAKLVKPYYQALPENLSFDEFKYAKGEMAFEYINAMTGDILDILDRRNQFTIKNHFITNYSLADRKCVNTVTIDMNAGYATIIKELFPNAEIIIDRFHLVQLISRSMNKCRIQVMNQLSKSNQEDSKKYRRLKRYWKLLLKNSTDISRTQYKNYTMFGQRTEAGIIEEMLTYSPVLKANYAFYQSLLNAMTKKDFEIFNFHLNEPVSPLVCGYMKTSIKTLKKHLPYIRNSFSYPYSNGRIEGINNKIKVLNRVAYGYRNFSNYKKRILIHFKFKSVETTLKQPPIEVA